MRIDDDDKVKAYEIKTIEIGGEELFYIEKGTCDTTILGLVKKHRKSHHLFVPINCDSEDESDNDSVELLSAEMEKRADTADISVLFFSWLC